jgi:hypothetical protein
VGWHGIKWLVSSRNYYSVQIRQCYSPHSNNPGTSIVSVTSVGIAQKSFVESVLILVFFQGGGNLVISLSASARLKFILLPVDQPKVSVVN